MQRPCRVTTPAGAGWHAKPIAFTVLTGLRRGLFTPDQIPELMQESHADAALRELSPASLIK